MLACLLSLDKEQSYGMIWNLDWCALYYFFFNFYKEIEILYLLARRENSNIRILATPLFFIKKKGLIKGYRSNKILYIYYLYVICSSETYKVLRAGMKCLL